MEAIDIYNQHTLHIDPSTKAISSHDSSLTGVLDEINKLHRLMLTVEGPFQVPPPPAPVNPKRSVQITKLRDSAVAAIKKNSFPDAIKLLDLAIKMAADRPGWEASGLVREELGALYLARAQVHFVQQHWPEAAADAEISVEMKKVGNVKAWARRGQCLKEMGRLAEAREWVQQGLDFERAGPEKNSIGELESLAKELNKTSTTGKA